MREAGIEEYAFIDWFREHPPEDDLTMLRWSDEVLHGKGYVDWYPFEHPQLGRVELGGWDHQYAFRNPPPEALERELARFPQWLVWHLAIAPKLELLEVTATALGDGAHRLRVIVQNSGWLPTYVTKQALRKKLVRGVICELGLPEGASLETGTVREELGQLEGRAYVTASPGIESTTDRAKAEWVVRAPAGRQVTFVARHERAGVVRAAITLPNEQVPRTIDAAG